MFSIQEELDWQCYRFYKVLDQDLNYHGELPPIQLGERAFEIVLARNIEAGKVKTVWFERFNSQPITEIPQHLPQE
jgi:hypothetical protein